MAQTVISGAQIKNATVQRQDLDVSTVGQAVVTKLVQGTNATLSSTGADSGTGDVTISVPTSGLITALAGLLVPTGAVFSFAGASAPSGFLLCDGSAISRTTYAALFTALGGASSPWGLGDGSTTFNLPDLRGRVSVGAGQGSTLTNRVLGANGGEESHVLSIAELAAHTHTITDPGHSHSINLYNQSSAGPYSASSGGADHTGSTVGNTTGITGTNSTGSGTAHNTMPPFVILNSVIKT